MGTGGFELSDNERNPPSHGCKRTRHNNRHTAMLAPPMHWYQIHQQPSVNTVALRSILTVLRRGVGVALVRVRLETGPVPGLWGEGRRDLHQHRPGYAAYTSLYCATHRMVVVFNVKLGRVGLGWAVQYYHNFALAASPYILCTQKIDYNFYKET